MTDAGVSFIILLPNEGGIVHCIILQSYYQFRLIAEGLNPSLDREVGSFLTLCVWGEGTKREENVLGYGPIRLCVHIVTYSDVFSLSK
jgi:hypothetical protein